jgi:mannan endo-1,6-alpha-mannosidase
MTALTAAEQNFPNPPPDQPQYLGLAQAVFNQLAWRYALEETPVFCNGGLRWQVYLFEDGYQYKNSISNACLFNLGARLARYTDNATYAEWAERTWQWTTGVGLMELQSYDESLSRNFSINGQGAGGYVVWDGTRANSNCSGVNGIPFTYTAGVFLHGAASMYNYVSPSSSNVTPPLFHASLVSNRSFSSNI